MPEVSDHWNGQLMCIVVTGSNDVCATSMFPYDLLRHQRGQRPATFDTTLSHPCASSTCSALSRNSAPASSPAFQPTTQQSLPLPPFKQHLVEAGHSPGGHTAPDRTLNRTRTQGRHHRLLAEEPPLIPEAPRHHLPVALRRARPTARNPPSATHAEHPLQVGRHANG